VPRNELLQETKRKLGGVTTQAVHARMTSKQKEFAPVSRPDALALVAIDAGIDITKYLEESSVSRIREILKGTSRTKSNKPPQRSNGRSLDVNKSSSKTVYIGREVKLDDPLLTPTMLQDAKHMAQDVYPKIYVFENSVRLFIITVMEKAHGKAWWATHAPNDVQKTVASRQLDEQKSSLARTARSSRNFLLRRRSPQKNRCDKLA